MTCVTEKAQDYWGAVLLGCHHWGATTVAIAHWLIVGPGGLGGGAVPRAGFVGSWWGGGCNCNGANPATGARESERLQQRQRQHQRELP